MTTRDRNFALPPLSKTATVFAWLLGAGIPATIAVGLVLLARDGEIPPLMAIATQALLALVILAVLLPMLRRRVAFDGRRIRVEAPWYTRESPLADFDLAKARPVDLREHPEM